MAERVRRNDHRTTYIRTHPLALTVAVVTALTGIVFLALDAPEGSVLVVTLSAPVAALWLVMSIIGGGLMLWGVWTLSPRWEAVGLTLMAAVFTADVYAIIEVRGASALLGSSPILGVALGAAIRAVLISRLPGGSSWKA